MILFSWQVELARPLWFAVLAALPLWIIFWRSSLVRRSPRRKVVVLVLRAMAVVAVAAGLAWPTVTGQGSIPVFVANENPPAVAAPPAVVLSGPDHVRAGEPFSLDLLVRSRQAGSTIVEWFRDGEPQGKETMPLVEGENRKSLSAEVSKPSRVVYAVKVYGPDQADGTRSVPATFDAACAIYVDPARRVLLVESQLALAEPFKKAMAGEGMNLEIRPELPSGPEALNAYDLIILSNVPAAALPDAEMKALQSYVRGGGGLIAVGGDRSFTAGGYRHTPLEDILPVISEAGKPKPKPTLAMVLVLDISGSMNDPVAKGAKERNIDLAKEALRRAVGMLGPRDQVGVLVFEDRSRWIWPLAPVADKQKIIARIDTIEAGGETTMYTPLEQAYLALREAYADVKHVIVTTDGIGGPGDFDGLARKMAAAGITMSTVGVGSEPVRPFLQAIADEAKGRAYFCENGKAIPQIFQTDTGAAAKIGITEEPFFPKVVHAADVLRGLDMSHAPTLLGYVDTQAKPDGDVVLAAKSGEPILVLGRYGRGATAAFTSDIQSRWAAPWLNWPGFGRFWAQLASATMRRDPPSNLKLTIRAADGRLWFTLDAVDEKGRYINSADALVTVTGSDEKSTDVPLSQAAPGRYTGSLAAGQGTYWLEGQVRRDGKLLDSVRRATVVLRMPETILVADGSVEAAEKSGMRTISLWPWLFAAGLTLLLVDLTVRRTASTIAG